MLLKPNKYPKQQNPFDEKNQKVEFSSVPEEAVEVSVPHVFEHHGQQLSVGADAVEAHDVLVLEDRQELRLPLEVLPGRLVGVFQSLTTKDE